MANSIITTILACLILGLVIALTIVIFKFKKYKKYITFNGIDAVESKSTIKKYKIIIWTIVGVLIALVIAAFIFSFTTTFDSANV